MSSASKRPCTYPGCGALTLNGRCEAHQRQLRREQDQRRGSSRQRGYTSKWETARAAWLREHPLCVDAACIEANGIHAGCIVDHRVPHKGDMTLFWDRNNWQTLCKPAHDRKTATEDGGFGRAPRVGVANP